MTQESVGILLTSRGACPNGSYLPKVAKKTCSDIDIQCCVYQGWGCVSSRLGNRLNLIKTSNVKAFPFTIQGQTVFFMWFSCCALIFFSAISEEL